MQTGVGKTDVSPFLSKLLSWRWAMMKNSVSLVKATTRRLCSAVVRYTRSELSVTQQACLRKKCILDQ